VAAGGTAAVVDDGTAVGRGRYAAVLAGIALLGLAVAGYLTLAKVTGGTVVCGPLGGCETVQTSEYSTVLGIPVSVYGMGYMVAVLATVLAWWRTDDRRALLGTYLLGLLGAMAVAYLVYLQLFVIHAICAWCMAFDTTVVAGFIAAIVVYRRTATA
jgi:uncharacterized membrane protein